MEFDFERVINLVISKINDIETESGDEFLELIITEVRLYDRSGNRLDSLSGIEYGLSRSRHWDKTNEHTMFHDGINEENLFDAFEDLDFPEETEDVMLQVVCDGMTDLEEPLNFEFEIKIEYGK